MDNRINRINKINKNVNTIIIFMVIHGFITFSLIVSVYIVEKSHIVFEINHIVNILIYLTYPIGIVLYLIYGENSILTLLGYPQILVINSFLFSLILFIIIGTAKKIFNNIKSRIKIINCR